MQHHISNSNDSEGEEDHRGKNNNDYLDNSIEFELMDSEAEQDHEPEAEDIWGLIDYKNESDLRGSQMVKLSLQGGL